MEAYSTPAIGRVAPAMPANEQRSALSARMIMQLFDYIDYPIIVTDTAGRLVWNNAQGKTALEIGEHLCVREKLVRPSSDSYLRQWHGKLSDAGSGEEGLLFIDDGSFSRAVSIAPLHDLHGEPSILANHLVVIMGKRQVCRPLSLRRFSAKFKLTPAEQRVTAQLLAGLAPARIAEAHTVSEATVRSQIKSILSKTGIASIRDLILALSRLPPLHMVRPE